MSIMCRVYRDNVYYKQSILIGGFLIVVFSITISIERIKKMNNHMEQKKVGSCVAQDKLGVSVVLEWHQTNIVSARFADLMKQVWCFARGAYVPVEMDFLKAFPEVVGVDQYFKVFEPLFAQGVANVDWQLAEDKMTTNLQEHFVFDPLQFPQQMVEMYSKDICYAAVIKEQSTGKVLGFISFLKRAQYAPGDIKVMILAVDVAHQKRGLGKLLMSSIFAIDPEVKRIFLCTRVTNINALSAYHSWGFVRDENPVLDYAFNLNHWTFMEYKVEQHDSLQKIAETFTE